MLNCDLNIVTSTFENCWLGNVQKEVTMTIDDATTSRLYEQCKGEASTSRQFGESGANLQTPLEILTVPCIVQFGFKATSKANSSAGCGVVSCAWICSSVGNDFLGSVYLPVKDELHATAVLNLTIKTAIANAERGVKRKISEP